MSSRPPKLATHTFDKVMTRFADRYADQNDLDFEAFSAAIDSGALEAAELA